MENGRKDVCYKDLSVECEVSKGTGWYRVAFLIFQEGVDTGYISKFPLRENASSHTREFAEIFSKRIREKTEHDENVLHTYFNDGLISVCIVKNRSEFEKDIQDMLNEYGIIPTIKDGKIIETERNYERKPHFKRFRFGHQ